MKGFLNLPWAITLSAITVQHLTLALPATPAGTGNDGIVAVSDDPLMNSTNAFTNAYDTYQNFPPGPAPPDEFLFYAVPDSVPPVTIKFQNADRSRGRPSWRPQPGRNEPAMRALLTSLVQQYSAPAARAQALTDPHYEWDQGPAPDVFITMFPEAPSEFEPQDLRMTGNVWANACRGFLDFLAAYPGLGIYYEVYYLYAKGEEFWAAKGILSVDDQAAEVSVA